MVREGTEGNNDTLQMLAQDPSLGLVMLEAGSLESLEALLSLQTPADR